MDILSCMCNDGQATRQKDFYDTIVLLLMQNYLNYIYRNGNNIYNLRIDMTIQFCLTFSLFWNLLMY